VSSIDAPTPKRGSDSFPIIHRLTSGGALYLRLRSGEDSLIVEAAGAGFQLQLMVFSNQCKSSMDVLDRMGRKALYHEIEKQL
jgi:hypothetical protein